MRLLPVLLASATFCLLAEAREQDVDAAVKAYEAQADDIAAKLLFAEFAKHPDRVHHLAFTFSVQVDAQGRPHNVKITSKTHDRFIEDTARRTLTAAKFPPVPKKVAQALGETLIRIQGDIDAEVSR
jgi:Gram-negative bacterial TonB protein C-terminal